ncbi:MAG: acetyl-CoA carboxylase, biotin carboxyl carrier protein [Acholeplasmataceae bacterium]|nr:acetyl-CoA carboxylase, biotin carboxyl carrier protein [Acholeplasmataceae bacterium]
MDFKQIQTIIKDFEKSSMLNLEIEIEGFRIKLSKQPTGETVVNTELKKEESTNLFEVKAPLVGTFYINNAQGEAFVRVGDTVEEGQTLCIIEAMKIMNEIAAPKSGTVEEIRLKNGEPVGFDQVMITIR